MQPKQLIIAAGAAVLVVLIVVVIASRRPGEGEGAFRPELLHDGASEVTIAWRTRSATAGAIEYRAAGSADPPRLAEERAGPARRHRVVLEGLEPSTRYSYWLRGGATRHRFQTKPLPTTPFSCLLVWGDVGGRIGSLVRSESPDFVLSLTPIPAKGPDPFREARASVPVYGPAGPSSRVLEQPRRATWPLDWGGLRLILAGKQAALDSLLDAPGAHTIGLVLAGGAPDLHARLVQHNQRAPTRPVAFVILAGERQRSDTRDGIVYLGLPAARGGQGAARLDVAPESVVAFLVDQRREITLRRSKVRQRRTCAECRRLADRGAYEESLKAYQEFIKTHEGHFQIDDAHLAIAEILDENLFRFRQAVTWYRTLVSKYPSSTLAPLARQRIAFLQRHADFDYKPLARFERIRKVEWSRHGRTPDGDRRILDRVQAIIKDYPSCSLAPVMQYWLANQYRQLDPDRAVATYRALIKRFPGLPRAEDAWIEIGETYYQARRYGEAIAAYQQALEALPAQAGAIRAQLERGHRNLRRRNLALGCGGLLLVILALGALWPPVGLSRRKLAAAGIAFLPLAAITLVGGWLIHEQFSGVGELLALALAISAAASFGFPFTSGLAEKLLVGDPARVSTGRRVLAAGVSLLAGLLLLGTSAYLALYLLNEHYLTGFKL